MIKLLFLFSFLLIVSCSSHKHKSINAKFGNTYSLQGRIEGRDSGWVFLGTYDTTMTGPLIIFDSAKISGSYFHFDGTLLSPLICKLKITDLEYGWPYTHYFVLDTGITSVQLFKDSMANSVITGSTLNEQLFAFNKKLNELELTFEKNFLLNKHGVITDDSLKILEKTFYSNKHELILGQIHANPTAITSAFIARTILNEVIELPVFEEICNALGNADNYFARYLSSKLAVRKRTVVGMQAPSFEIIGDKNRTFDNEFFKGKYLLLDFWASWCPPCREESPNLVSTYNKYAGKGIEMMSVSVDKDRNEWEKAMREDRLGWIQVCVGPNSKIEKDFGIYFIPSNLLIDPHGKIIAKNLIGEDLQKTLDFWLNKK
jgi:thiol-disulfide isomerase/thioredoxin